MSRGQNLVEFVVIVVLVAIVCIAILSLLGINVNSLFKTSYKKYENYKPFGVGYDKKTGARVYKAGELGGTAINPKKACSGDVCSIDYGDFVLNGVPDNFGDFVESSGTSGGTDKLLTLFEQIADQLEKAGDIDGAKDYRDLANLGHYLASIEIMGENNAKTCKSNANPLGCMGSKIYESANFTPPESISTLIQAKQGFHIGGILTCDMGTAQHYRKTDMGTFNSYKNFNPVYTFVDKYQKIINDSKYSSSLKGVTQELYLNIAELTKNMSDKMTATTSGSLNQLNFDPISGNFTGTHMISIDPALEDIIKPQTSIGNNINSALLCVAGKNLDTARSCH